MMLHRFFILSCAWFSLAHALEPAHRNLEYARAGEPEVSLKLDLYLPLASPAAPPTLVVWVHGGAWRSGSNTRRPGSLNNATATNATARQA